MDALECAKVALKAWESNDVKSIESLLSDNFVGQGLFPQPIGKTQYINFMESMLKAIPDWSFNARILDKHPLGEQTDSVHILTQITGTHTGDLVIPTLPVIPATGTKLALPVRQMEYVVTGELIPTITTRFVPNEVEEILEQLGMTLPR